MQVVIAEDAVLLRSGQLLSHDAESLPLSVIANRSSSRSAKEADVSIVIDAGFRDEETSR